MGVDAHVSGCSTKTLSFSVRDMLFCLWISVLLGHSKVHDVDDCFFLIILKKMEDRLNGDHGK